MTYVMVTRSMSPSKGKRQHCALRPPGQRETQDIEARQIEPQDITGVEEPAQHDLPASGIITWHTDRSDYISEDNIKREPCHSEAPPRIP